MSVVLDVAVGDTFPDEGVEVGGWLIAHRRCLDAGEAEWLQALARFDVAGGWADDGQLSCADWLVARAGMARATAYDRVRVARQLAVRPVLAAALAGGRVSYCAVRAMCRAEDATAEVDEALVALAEAAPVVDVEAAVRAYRLYRSQDQEPEDRRPPRRGLRVRRLGGGMARVEAVLTEVEAAELEAVLRLVLDRAVEAPDPAPGADAEQSSREDCRDGGEEEVSWPELRADALVEVVRGGLGEWAHGADRHMVHFVVEEGRCSALGGAVLDPAEAARIVCDCSHVTHVEDGAGAPLRLGRRQRVWSAAQRRAVTVRDDGHCRWPGCRRTRVDLHHLLAWEDGGATDVDNAVTLCPRHHHHLHAGWWTSGSPNATLAFQRPDGAPVGTSSVGHPAFVL